MSISFTLHELKVHAIIIGNVVYNGELSEELILWRGLRMFYNVEMAELAYRDRKIALGEFRRIVAEYKGMLAFISDELQLSQKESYNG